MLREAGPALLIGMPALESIEIDVDGETRTITPGGWRVVSASGHFTPEQVAELFADRPTEERTRPHWLIRWAVPLSPGPLPRTGRGAASRGRCRRTCRPSCTRRPPVTSRSTCPPC
nr:hypothetical protein GCM10020093_066450 [Planobispora longispora]